jgi:hypothetical protein
LNLFDDFGDIFWYLKKQPGENQVVYTTDFRGYFFNRSLERQENRAFGQ